MHPHTDSLVSAIGKHLLLLLVFAFVPAAAQDGTDPQGTSKPQAKDPYEKETDAHYLAMAVKAVSNSDANILKPMLTNLEKQLSETKQMLKVAQKAKVGVNYAAKYKANPKLAPLAYSSVEAKTEEVEALSAKAKEIERVIRHFEDKKTVFIGDSSAKIPVQIWDEYKVSAILEPNEVLLRNKYGLPSILQILEPATFTRLKAELAKSPNGFPLSIPLPLITTREGTQSRESNDGKKFTCEVLRNLDRERLERLVAKGGRRVVWDAPVQDWRAKRFASEVLVEYIK